MLTVGQFTLTLSAWRCPVYRALDASLASPQATRTHGREASFGCKMNVLVPAGTGSPRRVSLPSTWVEATWADGIRGGDQNNLGRGGTRAAGWCRSGRGCGVATVDFWDAPRPARRLRPPAGRAQDRLQVLGDAELDLVFMPGYATHLGLIREHPSVAGFLHGLASESPRAHQELPRPARPTRSPPGPAGRLRDHGQRPEVLDQDWEEAFLVEKCPGCLPLSWPTPVLADRGRGALTQLVGVGQPEALPPHGEQEGGVRRVGLDQPPDPADMAH
jgi:hypothetical protein